MSASRRSPMSCSRLLSSSLPAPQPARTPQLTPSQSRAAFSSCIPASSWLRPTKQPRAVPSPRSTLVGASRNPIHSSGSGRRQFSDEQKFRTRHGTIKVNLKAKQLVGIAQSRGDRPYVHPLPPRAPPPRSQPCSTRPRPADAVRPPVAAIRRTGMRRRRY